MKYIGASYTFAAEVERVVVFRDFEHSAMYIRGKSREEFFDLIAIKNLSPIAIHKSDRKVEAA